MKMKEYAITWVNQYRASNYLLRPRSISSMNTNKKQRPTTSEKTGTPISAELSNLTLRTLWHLLQRENSSSCNTSQVQSNWLTNLKPLNSNSIQRITRLWLTNLKLKMLRHLPFSLKKQNNSKPKFLKNKAMLLKSKSTNGKLKPGILTRNRS